MSVFRDFFVKEKPVFTGITRGVGGFGLGGGGAASGVSNFSATGGTKSTDGDATVHIFTSDDDFIIENAPAGFTCHFLVVAGGGAGGARGAGGGAGGLRSSYDQTGGGGSLESTLPFVSGTFAVQVGAGGAGADTLPTAGNSGGDSSLAYNGGTITSTGGGGCDDGWS